MTQDVPGDSSIVKTSGLGEDGSPGEKEDRLRRVGGGLIRDTEFWSRVYTDDSL